MAKTKISEFSSTPGNNTDIDSINISEGCAPSGINDAIRELMAQLKDFQTGAQGDSFNGPVGTTTAAAGAFTTLSASGAVTLSGGTANGVAYLNGSKVLTTGSALVFDGSNLGLGVTPSAWSWRALQVGSFGGIFATNSAAYASYLGNNCYYDGSNWRYIGSSGAVHYELAGGDRAHKWYTAPSGTAGNAISFSQVMTLDASGSLLIGATSVGYSAKSQFVKQGSTSANNSVTDSAVLVASANGAAGETLGLRLKTGAGISGTTFAGQLISSGNNIFEIYTAAASPLVFGTDATERARITSGGGFLIGTTSTDPIASNVNGVSFRPTDSYSELIHKVNGTPMAVGRSGTGTGLIDFYFNGASIVLTGSITTNGTTTAYNTSSDYRLKTLISNVTGSGERIDALNPVVFDWNSTGQRDRGFFAHQFQEVYPNSVTGSKDAVDAEGKPVYQAMQAGSSEVIADLVAEIKSLRARVAALESN